MDELQIEANEQLKFEFDRITEAGQKLEPLYGPGYTGMRNLGNRCAVKTSCDLGVSSKTLLSIYSRVIHLFCLSPWTFAQLLHELRDAGYLLHSRV